MIPFATSSPVCGENKSNVALSLACTSLLLIRSCVSIGPAITLKGFLEDGKSLDFPGIRIVRS